MGGGQTTKNKLAFVATFAREGDDEHENDVDVTLNIRAAHMT